MRSHAARGRSGAVVWLAIGLLAGTLGGLNIASASDREHAPMLLQRAFVIDALLDVCLGGGVAVCALLWVFARTRSRTVFVILLMTASACIGAINGFAALAFDRADAPRAHAVDEQMLVCVVGVVLADPVSRGDQRLGQLPGQDLLARFMRSPRGTTMQMAVGPERERMYEVQLAARPFPIYAGDLLRVRGWLEPDLLPRNPGGFDSQSLRRRRGVVGRIVVDDPALVERIAATTSHGGSDAAHANGVNATPSPSVSTLGPGDWLRAVFARGLVASLDARFSPAVRDMLVTMTLGTGGETLPAVRALFARTGLSHFIVISGFHLAVIASALLFLTRRAGVGQRGSGLVLIIASLFFLFLLESQISVVRAGLAGLVTGIVLMLNRGWPAMSVLALVTILVLLADPQAAGEPAFQLSFGAVAALLVLSRPMSHALDAGFELVLAPRAWLEHRWHRRAQRMWPRRFTDARTVRHHRSTPHPDALRRVVIARILSKSLGAAIVAWIVTAPITLHHFGHLSGWGVVGSFALAPLASLMAIVGLPAALIGAFSPTLAFPAGWLLGATGAVFLRAVELIAELPGACMQFAPQSGWWCAVMTPLPFLFAWAWRHRHRVPTESAPARCALVVALVLSAALALRPWWPRPVRTLEVVSLDLGYGRAVLVRHGRHTVLIDAGSRDAATAGTRIVIPALAALDALHLDAIVVTERSMRCLSAVPEVLRSARVRSLVVPAAFLRAADGSAPARLLAAAARLGVPVEALEPGTDTAIVLGPLGAAAPTLQLRAANETQLEVTLTLPTGAHEVPRGVAHAISALPLDTQPDDAEPRPTVRQRGAQRWCCDPISGWSAQRFGRRGWAPRSLWE